MDSEIDAAAEEEGEDGRRLGGHPRREGGNRDLDAGRACFMLVLRWLSISIDPTLIHLSFYRIGAPTYLQMEPLTLWSFPTSVL